jgi:hypothetical protein
MGLGEEKRGEEEREEKKRGEAKGQVEERRAY